MGKRNDAFLPHPRQAYCVTVDKHVTPQAPALTLIKWEGHALHSSQAAVITKLSVNQKSLCIYISFHLKFS